MGTLKAVSMFMLCTGSYCLNNKQVCIDISIKEIRLIYQSVFCDRSASRLVTTAALALASSPLEAKSHRRWDNSSFSRFVLKRLNPACRDVCRAEFVLDCAFISSSSCKVPSASRTKLSFRQSQSEAIDLQCALSSASKVLRSRCMPRAGAAEGNQLAKLAGV